MKKMMKNYEAPVAEMFEMQMPTVLMASTVNSGGWGGWGGTEDEDLPFNP
jgi:hypothetical protein